MTRLVTLLGACLTLAVAQAQSPSCLHFHYGTFLLPADHAGEEMKVVRRGNTQKEIGKNGHRSQYRVRWVDECTYELYDRRVTRGEDTFQGSPTDKLTVQILETWENGYRFRATSNFSAREMLGTMVLEDPKSHGRTGIPNGK